jgi:hypothetical protein
LAHLDEGLTRDEIAARYELPKAAVARIFKHPALKGKKTKPGPGFILVDDTVSPATAQVVTAAEVSAPVVAEAKAEEAAPEVKAEAPVAPAPQADAEVTTTKGVW